MEVKINKEVRDYHESLVFGLGLRQLVFAILAIIVAVVVYFSLKDVIGTGEVGWVCVLCALPFAMCGFFKYNGMTAEKFVVAWIRSEYLMSKKLIFKAKNYYYTAIKTEDKND